jgi:hypothetical protein
MFTSSKSPDFRTSNFRENLDAVVGHLSKAFAPTGGDSLHAALSDVCSDLATPGRSWLSADGGHV